MRRSTSCIGRASAASLPACVPTVSSRTRPSPSSSAPSPSLLAHQPCPCATWASIWKNVCAMLLMALRHLSTGGVDVAGEDFFDERAERSAVKSVIVSQYFQPWCVLLLPHSKRNGDPLVYLDLC